MSICTQIRTLILDSLEEILLARNEVIVKPDNSFVTGSDLRIQSLVQELLATQYPNIALISEELPNGGYDGNPLEALLVLDPLDGTENFVSGLSEWGVGVAVYEKGKHIESMILLPEMNRALLSGDPVKKFNSRIHGVSSSLQKDDLQFLDDAFEFRIMGCSMYNMYNVIHGSYAIFENIKGVNSWDLLPGINLALEHDCNVLIDGETYSGEFLPPTRKYRVKVSN